MCPSYTWAHIKFPSSLCVCTRVYKHTATHHPNTLKNREIYETKPLSLPLPKHSLQGFGRITTPKQCHENFANTLSDALRNLKNNQPPGVSWGGQTLPRPTCSLFPFPVPKRLHSKNKLFLVPVPSGVLGTPTAEKISGPSEPVCGPVDVRPYTDFRTLVILHLLQSHCTRGLQYPKQSDRRLTGSRLLPGFNNRHQ